MRATGVTTVKCECSLIEVNTVGHRECFTHFVRQFRLPRFCQVPEAVVHNSLKSFFSASFGHTKETNFKRSQYGAKLEEEVTLHCPYDVYVRDFGDL